MQRAHPSKTLTMVAALTIGLCISVAVPAAHSAEGSSADTEAIRQVFSRFNDALNRHDARAVADFCTPDADFIVIGGEDLHGRAAIEAHLNPLFAGALKNLRRDANVQEVRLLRPDVAVLIGDFTSSGVVTPAGATVPPSKGVYDWVLVKRGGQWMISLWHEANLPMRPPRRG